MTEQIVTTGTIRAHSVPELKAQIAKLNKRAAKCGVEPMVMDWEEYDKHVGTDDLGLDKIVRMADVTIMGEIPRIDGYRLIAKLTPVEGVPGQNFVKAAPGVESVDPKYRTIGMVCDHCGHNRNRNDVFVIEHTESGQQWVIGRNCAADYCRSTTIESIIDMADWIASLNDSMSEMGGEYEGGWGRGTPHSSPIKYFLKTASICIRKLGWLGRTQAFEQGSEGRATADTVCFLLWSPDSNGKQKFVRENTLSATEYDEELAEKALEWIRSHTDNSDYMYNLRMACSQDHVTYNTSGLVASLIPTYRRGMEIEVKRQKVRKAAAHREFIGEFKNGKGVRMRDLKLTVVGMTPHENSFGGVSTFVRFLDEHDNSVVWSATGDKTEDFEIGSTYIVDATPRKHEEHENYGKQTFVNRVSVKKEVAAA